MYASKQHLTHAFAFALATQAASSRRLRRTERTRLVARRPAFRRAMPRLELASFLAGGREGGVRAAFDAHRLKTWFELELARRRADDATTRRLCGKRVLPP